MEDLEKYIMGCDPYDLTDLMSTGMEMFHVSAEGIVRQVPVMSQEGLDILDKINNGTVGN